MSYDLDFAGLARELERRFAAGAGTPWPEGELNELALCAFRLQYERLPAFRALCDGRDLRPDAVQRWQDVPAVPARAFKHLELCVADPEVVFLTSGTTEGSGRRGRHLVPSAALYRASLLPAFERYMMAPVGSEVREPGKRMPFLSLIPHPESLPTSSLSFMVGAAAEFFATETTWVVDGSGVLDEPGLRAFARDAGEASRPVVALGTALALLHAVERLEREPAQPLPEGSRIMETGGFKGVGREVGRDELYDRVEATMGIPRHRIVSEYGMTELLSQLYTPVLSEGAEAAGVHAPPPWLKVRALDPVTLAEVAPGEPGLLAFFDLANAGSVCHVLTEDVGVVVEGRVELRGRVRGAEPRGCSRTMDELMSSAGSTT